MRLTYVPIVMLAVGAIALGIGMWRRAADPPRVISTGAFNFTDKTGTKLVFPQRVVAVAGFATTEVQLPGGTWIDCRKDCAEAIVREHTEIWDSQILKR